jgi:hypothetical protein
MRRDRSNRARSEAKFIHVRMEAKGVWMTEEVLIYANHTPTLY